MPVLPNAHALVVGVAAYRHVRPLPEVVANDAKAIADLLMDERYCGYPPAQVRLLRDEDATRDGVLTELSALAARANADSSVFLYFNGHGQRIESGPQTGEYLLTVEAEFPPAEKLPASAISGDEFAQALRAIPARKVVVVLDCCHAGGIGEPKDVEAPVAKNGLSEGYYDKLTSGTGRVIYASSKDTELSWAHAGQEFSVFTRHLLDGLRGGVASDDGMVSVFDLFEYLQPRVTEDEPRQHPVFKAEIEQNFAIALWQGGAKGTIPVDSEGFRYDAFVSYVDREPDATWVWDTLLPRLEKEGLRVVVAGDVREAGVDRVVSDERGITQSKRTIVVMSEEYLTDHTAAFQNVMGLTLGLQRGEYRLLPVTIGAIDPARVPLRLNTMITLDLAHPRRGERNFDQLVAALQGPLPLR